MKIWEAWLCLDCNEIFARYTECPVCGSRAKFPIARWLNRKEEPERAPCTRGKDKINKKIKEGGDAYGEFKTT